MASIRRNVVASVLFTVFGGPGILLVLVPWLITRFRVPAQVSVWCIGIATVLVVAGLAPLLESIVRFVVKGRGALAPNVPTEQLVVSGFYRFVRNPMYLGVFSVLAGEVVLFRSFGVLIEFTIVGAAMRLFVCYYEEPKLARKFGDEYQRYRAHVPRWIPRMRPWHGE